MLKAIKETYVVSSKTHTAWHRKMGELLQVKTTEKMQMYFCLPSYPPHTYTVIHKTTTNFTMENICTKDIHVHTYIVPQMLHIRSSGLGMLYSSCLGSTVVAYQTTKTHLVPQIT